MKKRILSIALVLMMVVSMIPSFAITGTAATITADDSWYDEAKDLFEIDTAAELLGFANLLSSGTTFAGKTVKLTADIDVNPGWEASATAPENKWANVTTTSRLDVFQGTFDGNYKTVSGIYLNYSSGATGIFGNPKNATVKNLVILNSYVNGTWGTGGIFGVTNGTNTIENVYADIDVTSNNSEVGGFIGRPGHESNSIQDTIKNCVYAGTVKTTKGNASISLGGFVGGIVSTNASVNLAIENSAFYGTVHAAGTSTPWDVGGMIGAAKKSANATIKNCISAGTVINGHNVATGAFYGRKIDSSVITVSGCAYTTITIAGAEQDWACNGAAWGSGAVEKATLIGTVPSGFTGFAQTAGYPRPTTMIEMTADIKDELKVKYTADDSWYSDGSSLFEIDTPEELLGFANLLSGGTTFDGKTVKLTADIDINPGWEAGSVAPTNVWLNVTGKTFSGTFDGDGHSISGIYLNYSCGKTGILGGIGKNATVKNLVLLNSYVYGTWGVGGIFGITNATNTIENVYAEIDVSAATIETAGVGGFIGSCGRDGVTSADVIKNSVFAGSVTGGVAGDVYTKCIGGFVGWVAVAGGSTTLENCAFYGTVNSLKWDSGGLFGKVEAAATIKNCISAGKVINAIENASVGAYYGRTNGSGAVTIQNSVYTNIVTNGVERDRAYNGAPLGSTDPATLQGPAAVVPYGFAAMPEGFAMPVTLVNVLRKDSENLTTVFQGYQNGDAGEIRLVGLVNIVGTDPTAELNAVGYDIEMTIGEGKTWTNKTEGNAPVIYSLYTSVLEGGKVTPTTAEALGGDYIFVATVTGINASYNGDITFVIKTFHDTKDGERVYDDIYVITYNPTQIGA